MKNVWKYFKTCCLVGIILIFDRAYSQANTDFFSEPLFKNAYVNQSKICSSVVRGYAGSKVKSYHFSTPSFLVQGNIQVIALKYGYEIYDKYQSGGNGFLIGHYHNELNTSYFDAYLDEVDRYNTEVCITLDMFK